LWRGAKKEGKEEGADAWGCAVSLATVVIAQIVGGNNLNKSEIKFFIY
jgi:hypothetical protein